MGLVLKQNNCNEKCLIIADDLQQKCLSSDAFLNLIIAGRHHGVLGVFLVCHSVFSNLKHARIINQNIHVYVLMKSCRLFPQIAVLGTQLGYGAKLKSVYLLATDVEPFSYLVIDVGNRCLGDKRLTLRSKCFGEKNGATVCYNC